jgi:hypothetical protein
MSLVFSPLMQDRIMKTALGACLISASDFLISAGIPFTIVASDVDADRQAPKEIDIKTGCISLLHGVRRYQKFYVLKRSLCFMPNILDQ